MRPSIHQDRASWPPTVADATALRQSELARELTGPELHSLTASQTLTGLNELRQRALPNAAIAKASPST